MPVESVKRKSPYQYGGPDPRPQGAFWLRPVSAAAVGTRGGKAGTEVAADPWKYVGCAEVQERGSQKCCCRLPSAAEGLPTLSPQNLAERLAPE